MTMSIEPLAVYQKGHGISGICCLAQNYAACPDTTSIATPRSISYQEHQECPSLALPLLSAAGGFKPLLFRLEPGVDRGLWEGKSDHQGSPCDLHGLLFVQ